MITPPFTPLFKLHIPPSYLTHHLITSPHPASPHLTPPRLAPTSPLTLILPSPPPLSAPHHPPKTLTPLTLSSPPLPSGFSFSPSHETSGIDGEPKHIQD
jgi:hypothetical protein